MTDWIIPFLCGLGASILSAWGVGGGTLLLLVMTLFLDVDQRTAQGINLLFFLPTAASALVCHARGGYLDKPTLKSAVPLAVAAALAGASESDFAALGLGYRARYLVRLTAEVEAAGYEDWARRLRAAGSEEAMERLTGLYGVGKKVAQCVCLFGLHQVDAFPVDTHIRRVLEAHYPAGFDLERYKGYGGILQQYLFYYDLAVKSR